ncbi:unnamed protein product, partial [Enterobius vermicularis]|uniref:DUF268 domain-containing protein n=1 Tax=Enterobius vermicularis TaxID=51028 RepID=A0A0N4VE76_ENTVE
LLRNTSWAKLFVIFFIVYYNETISLPDAGVVVGSINPWVESLCLKNGAKKLLTLEYNKIITDHEKLGYEHPIKFAREWQKYVEKFDFVISFSSIEHSGLGRYGDPLDPIGDIREMQKTWCILKEGGLAFLGLPSGMDGLFYNAHRVYGRVRLPLLFNGKTLFSQNLKIEIEVTDLFWHFNRK